MTTRNDSAELKQKIDDAIKAQFDILRDSVGALTVIGGLMAQASVDGLYPPDAQLAALQAYKLRRDLNGSLTKSDSAQISKLANFAYVALAWNRNGLMLVKALVDRTEGLPKRYHIVQWVLVRLKMRRQGTMPPISELVEMLKEAQAPRPRKASKRADTSTGMTPHDIVRALDTLIEDADTPTHVRAACELVKSFTAGKAVTPGVSDVPGASDG
jgi:hypothetical protein